VHKLVALPLQLALADCARIGGYQIYSFGCFSPRAQRGSKGLLSTHTWAIAVDINGPSNRLISPCFENDPAAPPPARATSPTPGLRRSRRAASSGAATSPTASTRCTSSSRPATSAAPRSLELSVEFEQLEWQLEERPDGPHHSEHHRLNRPPLNPVDRNAVPADQVHRRSLLPFDLHQHHITLRSSTGSQTARR
jgi:hypothetical protein